MGNITITGTGGIIEGNLGTANVDVSLDTVLEFDGTNDVITVSDHSSLDIVGDITLSAWVKITLGESDFKTIVAKAASLNNNLSPWQLRLDDSDKVEFVTGDGSAAVRVSSTNAIKEGWNHIAVTVDENGSSSVVKYFINGVLDRTVSSGWTDYSGYSNSTDLRIGVLGNPSSSAGYYFDGYLADVRIYNAVVSDADVAILASQMNGEPSLTTAGTTNLQGWWKLNNNSVTDSSPNSNNGTASNSPPQRYDQFHMDVYDNSTTTDGTFTITQGKLEGKALSKINFDGTNDILHTASDFTMSHDGSTISLWVNKDNSTGNEDTLMGETDDANQHWFKIDTNGDIEFRDYPANIRCDTAITDTNWRHVVVTLNGDNNGKIYVDGVEQHLTNNNITSDPTFDSFGARGSTTDPFDGQMQDIRVYDYALSSEQVNSLYSNTYPQTPLHHWKLDEGGYTGSYDRLDSGTATAKPLNASGATMQNGTLDLDGALTVAANGVLSAPRGDLDLSANFTLSADNTFVHNNGTFKPTGNCELLPVDYDSSENERHIFYDVDHTGGTLYIERPTTIENTYTKSGGDTRHYTKCTFGTATSAGTMTINSGAWVFYGYYGSPTLQGANQLYPVTVTGTGYTTNGPIDIDAVNNEARSPDTFNYMKWVKITKDIVSGGDGGDIVLQGDVEFAGLTLSDGDQIDLNSQRLEFTGAVSLAGDLIDTNNGGLVVFNSTYTRSGGHVDLTGGTNFLANGSGTCDFYNPVPRILMLNTGGSNTITFNNPLNEASSGSSDLIVASGTINANNQNINGKNQITIVSGGTYQSGTSTMTCKEDFNICGGIIGKSALDFDGTSECRVADHSDFDSLTNATWMGWYKIDDVSTDSNFIGQSSSFSCQVFENSTNKPRFSLYDSGGSGWTDLEGNTTITVDNKWHHIAFVMDGSNNKMRTFIDGKLDSEGAWTGTLNGSSADIFIGGYRDGNVKGFKGILGNASFWNVALTEAQIRKKMFYNFAGLDSNTGCKGWWQFDEGTGGNGATTASSVGSHPATIGPAGNVPNWVGAGTLTPTISMATSSTSTNFSNSSKLKMTGAGKALNYLSGQVLPHLQIANTSGTITATVLNGTNNLTVASLKCSGSDSEFSAPNGTLTITAENSDGMAVECGAFNNCVPSTLKHNNGTILINNHSAPCQHGCLVVGVSTSTDGVYNVTIDGANTIASTYAPSGGSQHCTIYNDFTVTNGNFKANASSNPFSVIGDVAVNGGNMFNTGNAPSAAHSLGSLTIGGSGTYKATSGTTTINNEASSGYAIEVSGTYTASAGTLKITTDANTLVKILDDVNHLIIEPATATRVYEWVNNTTTQGNLTINAGRFAHYSQLFSLDVQGDCAVNNTGILDGGSGSIEMNSLTIASGGEYRATTGTTTVTGESGSGVNLSNSGTFTHNEGHVKVTCASQTSLVGFSGTNGFYDYTYAGTGSGQDQVCGGNTDFFGHVIIDSANSEVQMQAHTFNLYNGITIKQGGWDIGSSDTSGTVNVYGHVRNVGGTVVAG